MNRIAPTLHVDLDALRYNYREMQRLASSAEVGASVKANAYGLGVARVVSSLMGEGCRTFFVATPEEALEVRDAAPDADIHVLNGLAEVDLSTFVNHDLIPVLSCREALDVWTDNGRDRACTVMFDTGMNRLGLAVEDAETVAGRGLSIVHVMSHLACSEDAENPMNARQRAAFETVLPHFQGVTKSLSNSGGVYLGAAYHYDMVRPGIALYGGRATLGVQDTRPVATVEATVLQVRNVAAGESVGYDATFIAEQPMRVATVGIGYADGLPVALSNRGFARWAGKRLPIVGRVSMDLTCLDIGDHPLGVGDSVTFLGSDLSEMARLAGTIDYEILSRSGSRLRCDTD